MPIWKLTPLDLRDPNWEASSHQAFAIVRARSEAVARATAARAFDVKTGFRPGKGQIISPWMRPALVKTEAVDDERYDDKGPAAVLQPPF